MRAQVLLPKVFNFSFTYNTNKKKLYPGDVVEVDDEIIILESMKMEIPISSEYKGKIKSIEINEGDEVDEGQTVAILE